jgi:hypothetical protein
MANEQKQPNTNNPQTETGNRDVHGRLYNSQNPAFEHKGTRNDISNVDQQEGNMNNGECGGNLDTEKAER